jgi:glycosyltransferase involved in cell wall biosynthesis
VEVTWLDSAGWRSYKPTLYWNSPHLTVRQMRELPGRRFGWLDKLSVKMQANGLKALMKAKKNPVLWVQDSLDERICSLLPSIDVFSVFDNPSHSPNSNLCKKSKLIICQNQFANELYSRVHPGKVELCLPPMEMEEDTFSVKKEINLPKGFPNKVMGYIGSFLSSGFDLAMFESFIKNFPDWGFVLMGRTDDEGMKALERWKKYPNFHSLPWVPREEVASAWRLLDVSLLLYRPCRLTDGAFPVKVLESLHFGVPCVATSVPKTSSLEGFFPRTSFPSRLRPLAVQSSAVSPTRLNQLYAHFAYEMDPKLHLARVAEALSRK